MRKDRLYFYTFLAITILFVIIGGIASDYFVKLSAEQMLENKLSSSNREAKEMAQLIGALFEAEIPNQKISSRTQETIKNSNNETSFISILDWSGKIICHPDITLVGTSFNQKTTEGFTMNSEISLSDFYEYIIDSKEGAENSILSLNPVPNSDWLVASHVNTDKIAGQLKNIRNRFYAIFGIMGFIIVFGSVITVRLLGSLYEKQLEQKNDALETELIGLAKLNSDLNEYQKKVEDNAIAPIENTSTEETLTKETGKKRILTYLRNELLPIATSEISYIYTENTITYVVDTNGKKSTTNSSLDELFSGLDPTYFYRANRQFIIAISSIDKIIRYGNNQLKLLVNPKSEVDIIIGKNKAAEFKQWLNL